MREVRVTAIGTLLMALGLFIVFPGLSQAQKNSPPISYVQPTRALSLLTVHELPQVDAAQRMAEDARIDNVPLRFAIPVALSVSPDNAGHWETIQDGGRLWRYRVYSRGATDLNFGFSNFQLPPGATLHIHSESEHYFQGPYTAADNRTDGELWTSVVPGESAVIELYIPADETYELELSQVGTGYRDLFGRKGAPVLALQEPCNIDVACSQGDPWRPQIRSVARYSRSGSVLCTGTLIMDVPGTFSPYFLTANHCGVTSGNAASIVAYWNFESPTCGALGGGSLADNQSGATLRASRSDVDVTLLELDQQPDSDFDVFYSGWSRTGVPPVGAAGIHHPGGDEKAISIEVDPLQSGPSCIASSPPDTHWYVSNWEEGTTEGGSSGSGLWSTSNKLLVGVLSGGTASCATGGFDCYGKFGVAWDGATASVRLHDWLDPNGDNPSSISGQNPSTLMPGTLAFSVAAYSVAEDGGSVSITVNRSGGSDGSVSVDYATADGSATAGTDYSTTSGTLTFSDSETSRTFTVPITNDTAFEPDETFSVSLSNVSGGATVGTPSTASVTISDNDPAQPGVLQFSTSTYSVAEDGASLTITVTRSGGSDGVVSVDYATADGSATAGSDYLPSIGTLVFADAETSRTFVVSILDDNSYEDDESLQLSLSNVQGGATLNGITQATLTVTDDEPIPPAGALEFDTTAYSVLENSAVAVISVTRFGGSFGDVSVDYATSDGSATAGLDYQPTTGTITLADGQTNAQFELALVDDTVFEGDETVNMTLANTQGGAGLGANSNAVLTILENDPEPPSGVVQFEPTIFDVAEDAASVVLSVIRTGGTNGQISVEYNSMDNSATAPADYAAVSGTLVFEDGESNKSIAVTLIDDLDFEGDETFDVVLSDFQGGSLLGPADTATIRIAENDQPPQPGVIQISGTQFDVNENEAAALVTVLRTGGDSGQVTVDYATNDVTASAGEDYQPTVGTLVFADGVTSLEVIVPLIDDSLFEAAEDFTISLTNVTGGAALGTPQIAGITIIDNDPQPPAGSLQLSGTAISVVEDGLSIPIAVVRTGGVFGDVTIDYTTVDGSATVASGDYQSSAGTLTFSNGVSSRSFSVTIFDDDFVEGNEIFDVFLNNPQGGAAMGEMSHAEITIVENDFPKPGTLQFTAASMSATESVGGISIVVSRIDGSDGRVSGEYSASGGTATSGSDYNATSGTLVFADGITSQSFTVPIIDDAIVETNETISFSLSNVSGGASLGDPVTIVVTISDNDNPPPAASKSGGGAVGWVSLAIVSWFLLSAGRRRRSSSLNISR